MHAHRRSVLTLSVLLAALAAAPAASLAQAPPGGPGGPSAEAGANQMIAQLRQAIRPTPAQMPQFTALAEVIRSNAQAEATMQPPNPQASAPDQLSASIRFGEQELEGMRRMLPALQSLYAVLSPAQRRAADATFQRAQQQGGPPPR